MRPGTSLCFCAGSVPRNESGWQNNGNARILATDEICLKASRVPSWMPNPACDLGKGRADSADDNFLVANHQLPPSTSFFLTCKMLMGMQETMHANACPFGTQVRELPCTFRSHLRVYYAPESDKYLISCAISLTCVDRHDNSN